MYDARTDMAQRSTDLIYSYWSDLRRHEVTRSLATPTRVTASRALECDAVRICVSRIGRVIDASSCSRVIVTMNRGTANAPSV